MLEVHDVHHVGALVVRGSRLWMCDHGQSPDSVIVEYRAKPENNNLLSLKIFLQQVFSGPNYSRFHDIQVLIDQSYVRVGSIPLANQYSENCPLQAWLLGLRCVFVSMNVPLEKYRWLTGIARKLVWADALQAVEKDASYKLPMLMAHIMKPEGSYPLEGVFEIISELLLEARKAFSYAYNRLHTYETGSD